MRRVTTDVTVAERSLGAAVRSRCVTVRRVYVEKLRLSRTHAKTNVLSIIHDRQFRGCGLHGQSSVH